VSITVIQLVKISCWVNLQSIHKSDRVRSEFGVLALCRLFAARSLTS
jgi:hypothetical protein